MNMMKKLALLVAVVLCAMSLLSAIAEEAPAEEPVVLATVNGIEVTTADWQVQYDRMADYYRQNDVDVTLEKNVVILRDWALENAIQSVLAKSKAVEMGLAEPSEEQIASVTEELTAQWNEIVDYYAEMFFGASENSTEEELAMARTSSLALLESSGVTLQMWIDETVDNLWYENLCAALVSDMVVTDEDVAAAYAEMVAEHQALYEGNVYMYEVYTMYMGEPSYYVPEGYRGVRHILLNVDEELLGNYNAIAAQYEEQIEAVETGAGETAATAVTQEDVDAAAAAILASVQPTIDEIHQHLEEGMSFSELIEMYGNDPGMTVEPNKSLGYDVHIESVVYDAAFTKGAFTMENVGDISEPIISSYGVHILEYTRDVPAGAVELSEEEMNQMKATMITDKENAIIEAQVEAWRAEATVEYTDAGKAYLLPEK